MRGGKREGAGRHKTRPGTEVIALRILPEYAERIRREAKERGVPTGQIVEEYMKEEAE